MNNGELKGIVVRPVMNGWTVEVHTIEPNSEPDEGVSLLQSLAGTRGNGGEHKVTTYVYTSIYDVSSAIMDMAKANKKEGMN